MVTAALVATAAALVGFAAWEGGLGRQSAAAHLSVALTVVTAFAAALIGGRGCQRRSAAGWVRRVRAGWRAAAPAYRVGIVTWAVLFAAVVGWDVNSFVHQSHDLPTLSGVIGTVTRHHAGRGLVFAAWVVVGAYLALGRRTERHP